MEEKNSTINAVKGIAILLVVYGHVIQNTMLPNGKDFFLNPAFKLIYTFHMPLFVFISGYLLAFSLEKKNINYVFITRCKSLMIPFLSWGLLGILTNYVLLLIDHKNINLIAFPWDLVDQLLLHPSVWFLFTLFIISCTLLYSIHLEKKLSFIAFIAIYFVILIIPFNDYFALYYIKWFYMFYMAGYFLNKLKLKFSSTPLNFFIFLIAFALFLILTPFWNKDDYIYIHKMNFLSNQYSFEILRMAYRYFLGFLGIFITFYIATYCLNKKMKIMLGVIGMYSLDIYLIQRYLVEGIYRRLVPALHLNFDFNEPFFIYFFSPCLVLLFTCLCIFISRTLIKQNYLVNKLLLGGRA